MHVYIYSTYSSITNDNMYNKYLCVLPATPLPLPLHHLPYTLTPSPKSSSPLYLSLSTSDNFLSLLFIYYSTRDLKLVKLYISVFILFSFVNF